MNDKTEMLWIDMLSGMQNRATQLYNDGDYDKRNRNWYAREVYEEKYVDLKSEFQRQKMGDLDQELQRTTYSG